jgi:hypothetical protein
LGFAYPRFGIIPISIGLLYWLRFVIYSGLIFTLPIYFNSKQLPILLWLLGITVVFTSVVQYLVFPDIRSLQLLEWDPHYYRVVGSLLDPGFTGLILIFFMIRILTHPLPNKIHQYIILTTTYIYFAFTYSRSSFISLLFVSIFISYTKKTWKPFLITLFVLITTIILLPRAPDGEGVKLERTSSITARIQNWSNSISIFLKFPVFGSGFNVYRYTQRQFGFNNSPKWLVSHSNAGADSSLLFVAATTGLIGLILYLNYLRSLFHLRAINYELIAIIVHSVFLNSLFYPYVLLWLAVSIASKNRNLPSE